MTAIPAPSVTSPISRPRRLIFSALAALLAVFTGVVMGGVFALVGTFTATGEEVIHQVHALHWGALMVVLTAVPLVVLAVRPTVAAAQQVAIVIGSFVVAALVARMFDPTLVLFPVLIALLFVLHPDRSRLFRDGADADRMSTLLAAAVTAPALWYAWSEIQTHLAAPLSDPHRGPPEAHYVSGAGLTLAIAAVAWLASRRTDGWRVPAWCAGLAMAMTGAVSIWLPDWVSSFGRGWGTAALLWGLAFIAAAEIGVRRDASRR
jgi:hypothetical protein